MKRNLAKTLLVAGLAFAPAYAYQADRSGSMSSPAQSQSPSSMAAEGTRDMPRSTDVDDDNDFDMGWLGLIGLAGLAGFMRKTHNPSHTHRDPVTGQTYTHRHDDDTH